MRAVVLCALAATALAANCPVGSYTKPADTACVHSHVTASNCCMCAAGTYNPSVGRDKCTSCMVGRYSAETGSSSSQDCKVCPAGWFHPTNDDTKANKVGATLVDDVCTKCSKGRFNSMPNKAGNEAFACTQCAAGRYGPDLGAKTSGQCIKCVSDTKSIKKDGSSFVVGAATEDDACEDRAHDCIMKEWSPFGRCSLMCGGGKQTRTRTQETPATPGHATTKGCATLDERPCNTKPCSAFSSRFPSYTELGNGLWWEIEFPDTVSGGSGLPGGMDAECRRQKNEATGPWRFENVRNGVQNSYESNDVTHTTGTPVDGWCCKITTKTHETVGETLCYESRNPAPAANEINFLGTKLIYDVSSGKLVKDGSTTNYGKVKPMFIHSKVCDHTTCSVDYHNCTVYNCPERGANEHLGGFCPNRGVGACTSGKHHTSIRVNHPGHKQDETADGHFCRITQHKIPVSESVCTCYCLDVYKRQSSLDGTRYQRAAQYGGVSAKAMQKIESPLDVNNPGQDQTKVVNPHFNHDVQLERAAGAHHAERYALDTPDLST